MTGFRVLRSLDRQTTRWKNGRGWTTEIAIAPPRSTLETFDWRISIAGSDSDGPFSVFAGIDRTLALLEGRIVLSIQDRTAVQMSPGSSPVAFSGDLATSAALLEGPLVDFNVMTRRDRFHHEVFRRFLAHPIELSLNADVTFVVSLHSGLRVIQPPHMESLAVHDALLAPRSDAALTLVPCGTGEIFLIRINRSGD